VAQGAETKHRHWVEPAMVCQARDAMIQRQWQKNFIFAVCGGA
jgi:hypothetical protein